MTIPGIPEKWFKLTANGGIGYQFIDKNNNYGTPSYLTWTLGLTANIKGVDIGVAYIDTNIDKNDCFGWHAELVRQQICRHIELCLLASDAFVPGRRRPCTCPACGPESGW